MSNLYSTEDLIINDSFINYCLQDSPEDIAFWESYLLQNPQEADKIQAARIFIFDLRSMMRKADKEVAIQNFKAALGVTVVKQIPRSDRPSFTITTLQRIPLRLKKWMGWSVAACFILLLIFQSRIVYRQPSNQQPTAVISAAQSPGKFAAPQLLASGGNGQTGKKEKKIFILPDGTKVSLNSESTLALDKAFGANTRQIYLTGEAFFDVAHNAAKPFVVHLKDFDVKVLGTMFNVRSYKLDRNSETSLVKGKVEILIHNNPDKPLFLKPNQKLILSNEEPADSNSALSTVVFPKPIAPPVILKPLTISSDGNSIVETAWIHNRLEINDELFENLIPKLERWFGVKIAFTGNDVKNYRFTATFENETIEQALKALQLSYRFNYEIYNDKIMIRK